MTISPFKVRSANIGPNPCKRCGGVVRGRNWQAVYCSVRCEREANRDRIGRYLQTDYKKFLPIRASMGSISELLVSVDLLKRGYEVYRSVSPHSACDMICSKDGKLTRVEVKTARRLLSTGKFVDPQVIPERHDLLALVDHNGVIEYRPSLSTPPA